LAADATASSIIATNTADTDSPDVSGVVVSQGYNLIGIDDGSSGWVTSGAGADLVGTMASPINPMLNPLGDYGGPTPSMTLQPGSPARQSGNPAAVDGATDQRGFARVVNGLVDIGAVEMQPGQ
jgi:hypothetical protein